MVKAGRWCILTMTILTSASKHRRKDAVGRGKDSYRQSCGAEGRYETRLREPTACLAVAIGIGRYVVPASPAGGARRGGCPTNRHSPRPRDAARQQASVGLATVLRRQCLLPGCRSLKCHASVTTTTRQSSSGLCSSRLRHLVGRAHRREPSVGDGTLEYSAIRRFTPGPACSTAQSAEESCGWRVPCGAARRGMGGRVV